MIKQHGVSLTQMVLTGDIQLLRLYLNKLNTNNANEFMQEFVLLEKVLYEEEPQVTTNNLVLAKYGITPAEFRRLQRKYEQGKDTQVDTTVSQELYQQIKEEYETNTIVLPNRFDATNLNDNQIMWASVIFKQIKDYYEGFNFRSLYSYRTGQKEELILGGKYNNIWSILYHYSNSGWDIPTLTRELEKLKAIIAKHENTRRQTSVDIRSKFTQLNIQLSSVQTFAKVFDISLPNIDKVELYAVILQLAKAGIVGLDTLVGSIKDVTSQDDIIHDIPESQLLGYKLLAADIESIIHFGGKQ